MKRKIIWEYYLDPLNTNYSDVIPDMVPNTPQNNNDMLPYDDNCEMSNDTIHSINPITVMSTPFGLISLTDQALVCSQFIFWTAHTNFSITPEIVALVEEIPGVETLDVYTRYRMRIGCPKSGLFDPSKVKQDIQNALLNTHDDDINNIVANELVGEKFGPQVADLVNKTQHHLQENKDHWAIFVLPNGEISTVCADDNNVDFQQTVELFTMTQALIGGQIIMSEDDG